MIRLDLPIEESTVRQLRVGDQVSLHGTIVTARDAAHKYMIEAKRPDRSLKALLDGTVIYHCGPVMKKHRNQWQVVAAGPTTSIREEPYQGKVLERYGARAVMGKGGMGPKTSEACKKIGAVYLHAVGGAAVYLAQRIVRVVDVRMLEELGVPEAFWILEVDGFPAVVTMDSRGESLHSTVAESSKAACHKLMRL